MGQRISVSVGPGNYGEVVGSRISVSVGPRDPEELQLIQDLRQQAAEAEAGKVDKTRIQTLLSKAGKLASAGVTAVTSGVKAGHATGAIDEQSHSQRHSEARRRDRYFSPKRLRPGRDRMPQFSVTLYRKVVSEQIAELKVDASSEAEARLKAAERA